MANSLMRLYHILYGKHSKIPTCCVSFFVNCWDDVHWNQENFKAYSELHEQQLPKYYQESRTNEIKRNPEELGVEYIPCPECLRKKNFIEIHTCERTCNYQKQLTKRLGLYNEFKSIWNTHGRSDF
jgi:hypothetical protein